MRRLHVVVFVAVVVVLLLSFWGLGVFGSGASPRERAESKANAVLAAHHVDGKASCVRERDFPDWMCTLTGPGVGARPEYDPNRCTVFGVNAGSLPQDGRSHVACVVGARDQVDLEGVFDK